MGNLKSDLSWVDALMKKNQPTKQEEAVAAKVAAGQETPEDVESALKRTSDLVFNLPIDRKTPAKEAITEASKKVADQSAAAQVKQQIDVLKNKLGSHGVDPVGLGVVTKAEWDAIADISKAEELAKKAALAAEKEAKKAWEKNAAEQLKNPAQKTSAYNPETDRAGRITPATAGTEKGDTSVRDMTPANANSILNPNKLDELAKKPTAHDESVAASRKTAKERKDAQKDWRTEQNKIPDDMQPMKGSEVIKSGGQDADIGRYKVPANQLSIADGEALKKIPPEQLKDKLAELFTSRIPDHGEEIKEAAKEHKAEIQRPKEKDKSWEEVKKPLSTKEITERLTELWLPPKPDDKK